MTIPLGKLGYLAPRIHRVLSESLSESLSTERYSAQLRRRIPVLGRFMGPPEDTEANLAARVRGGTAPITRTGQGTVPSKVGRPVPKSSGNDTEAEESSGARTDDEGEAGGSGTATSSRRGIQFLDEIEGGSGSRTPRREIQFSDDLDGGPGSRTPKREIQFSDEVDGGGSGIRTPKREIQFFDEVIQGSLPKTKIGGN